MSDNLCNVTSIAFSPDGRRIVSGSRDKTLKVWDTQTGQEVITLTGHTGYVTSVAFHPNGKWIVSGIRDETIRMWDADRSRLRMSLFLRFPSRAW